MTTSTTTAPATPAQDLPEVANLHEARKAQSAAKAPAKQPEKAAKAPAKKAAGPAPEKPAEEAKAARPKLRWTLDGERDEKGRVAQHGTGADGTVYQITGAGDQWKATVTPPDGKPEVLGDGVGHTKAYTLCTAHAKGRAGSDDRVIGAILRWRGGKPPVARPAAEPVGVYLIV